MTEGGGLLGAVTCIGKVADSVLYDSGLDQGFYRCLQVERDNATGQEFAVVCIGKAEDDFAPAAIQQCFADCRVVVFRLIEPLQGSHDTDAVLAQFSEGSGKVAGKDSARFVDHDIEWLE